VQEEFLAINTIKGVHIMPVSTVVGSANVSVFHPSESFDKKDKKNHVQHPQSAAPQEPEQGAPRNVSRPVWTPWGPGLDNNGRAIEPIRGEPKSHGPGKTVCVFPRSQGPVGEPKPDGPGKTGLPVVTHPPGEVTTLPAHLDGESRIGPARVTVPVLDGAARAGSHQQTNLIRKYEDPRAELLLGSGEYSPTKDTLTDQQIKEYWLTHSPEESFDAALLHNVSVDRIVRAVVSNRDVMNGVEMQQADHIRAAAQHYLESKGVDIQPLPLNSKFQRSSYVDLRSEILFNHAGVSDLSRSGIRAIANDQSLSVDQKITQFLIHGAGVDDVYGALRDPGATQAQNAQLYDRLLALAITYARVNHFDIQKEALYHVWHTGLIDDESGEADLSLSSPGKEPTVAVELDDTVYPETLDPAIIPL